MTYPASEPVIIKKYANRRLYNTETSAYVTLDDLCQMVKDGRDFEVVDAKTGSDMTRQVLAQIIFEEESKNEALMPIAFLRQLIQFYDHSMRDYLPQFLETTMDMFQKNQPKASHNPFDPVANLQAMQEQQMAFIQRSMNMFNPFAGATEADKKQQVKDIEDQIRDLQAQLKKLKK